MYNEQTARASSASSTNSTRAARAARAQKTPPAMPEPFPILKSLILEQIGESSYRGPSVPSEVRPVVFGGQLMGQMIVAATTRLPGKTVRSLHAIFARAGTVTQPVDLEVDVMHSGRALG